MLCGQVGSFLLAARCLYALFATLMQSQRWVPISNVSRTSRITKIQFSGLYRVYPKLNACIICARPRVLYQLHKLVKMAYANGLRQGYVHPSCDTCVHSTLTLDSSIRLNWECCLHLLGYLWVKYEGQLIRPSGSYILGRHRICEHKT